MIHEWCQIIHIRRARFIHEPLTKCKTKTDRKMSQTLNRHGSGRGLLCENEIAPALKHVSGDATKVTLSMIIKRLLPRWIVPALALTVTSSLLAKSVPVSGPPSPGHARPPLHINVTPSTST